MKYALIISAILSIFFLTFLSKASVFCEYTTTTNCQACPEVSEALYEIYNSHQYPFYYVSFIVDKNEEAEKRATQYNVYGYPTAFFDGGYKVIFGKHAKEIYINAIKECVERNKTNIEISLNTHWIKDGLSIDLDILNDHDSYKGNLRIYVVEPKSKYKDYIGKNFHYAFIGYAMNKNISIGKGKVSYHSLWKTNITDNLMVIAVLFNGNEEKRYSDPPANKHAFKAHFVDACVAAKPKKDEPPSLNLLEKPSKITGYRNIRFKWEGNDDSGSVSFSYKLEGYEEWHEWSKVTEANYTLNDGNYRFLLKGKDNIGQITKISYSFKVDTSPPTIIYTYPKNNEINFPPYKTIVIKFSHPMNKKTIKIKFNPYIEYSLKWKNDYELKIIPYSMKYETKYTIYIEGERLSGQKMKKYSFSFETSPKDTTQPYILYAKPFYEEYYDAIYIKFSKPMDKIIFKGIEINPWMPYIYSWKENDTLLVIKLLNISLGNYSITITKYMQDKYGNSVKPFNFEFFITKPRIIFNNVENNVLLMHEPIEIKFSNDMDKKSIEEGLKIKPRCNYTIKWNGNRSMEIIGEWKNEKYFISISNARDIRNISMDDYSFSFKTSNDFNPSFIQHNTPSFSIFLLIISILLMILVKRRKNGNIS